MCLADYADYGYAQSVETERQYALRESQQYLRNRGYELTQTHNGQVESWRWTLRGQKGPLVESHEVCIISAFVHLAHNGRKL